MSPNKCAFERLGDAAVLVEPEGATRTAKKGGSDPDELVTLAVHLGAAAGGSKKWHREGFTVVSTREGEALAKAGSLPPFIMRYSRSFLHTSALTTQLCCLPWPPLLQAR